MSGQIIAEIKILPVGTPTPSLSRYISACAVPSRERDRSLHEPYAI